MVDWLGIPAAFIAWGFALYVYAVAPPSRSARFLIAMLMVDGLAVITGYYNSLYYNPFLVSLGLPEVPTVLHQMSDWALVAVYLPFLGMNLRLYSSSTAGMRNASVLPLPVFAAPIKSLLG